jgi:hypothetical protein
MNFPFSQNLFWDTDIAEIDMQKHKRYVIERVLTRGTLNDFRKLITLYSKEEIKNEIVKSKILDPKTAHFCNWYFGIPIDKLHVSSFYH